MNVPLRNMRYRFAVLEGEEMLQFRNGGDMYTYCKECMNMDTTPVTGVQGCSIGDDAAVAAFSNDAFEDKLDPEIERCPGFESRAQSTPGVGAPREAAIHDAGMTKDIPAELRPHTKQEWEQTLNETLEDLSRVDPKTVAFAEYALDMIDKHEHLSQEDPEQEYDFFGPDEEHPSGNITYPKKQGQLADPDTAERAAFYEFLDGSGLGAAVDDMDKKEIVSMAMASWRDGLMASQINDETIQAIIADYDAGNW